MKKIIVPSDFSEGAFNALKHAAELANEFDTAIEVVHAFSMPTAGSTVMVDITDILEKNAKEELDTLAKRVSESGLDKGIEFTYSARHGSVVDVLERLSKVETANLVVMGTHGTGGFSEQWMGSNAVAATKAVKIPLLIIPANRVYKRIKNILFATDMKVMKNDTPLHILARITKAFDCDVSFVHIQKTPTGEDFSEYKSQVSSLLGEEKPHFKIVENDNIEIGITKAIEEEQPDLLVAVRHSYGFFEGLFHSSISQHIVNTSAIPVLVVTG